MGTMKALWWTGPDRIELLRDVPVPETRPGTVKIKIAYSALCATDLHMVSMGVMNVKMAKGGQGLGHEASGEIAEVGPGAELSGLKVGDKVVMIPGAPCGQCANCKNGFLQYCRNAGMFSTFCEYAVVPTSGVFRIPDDADMRAYALVEPSGCTIRAMDLSPIRHGQKVLVSGAGGIGSILLDMVIHSGAAKITVSDPVPQKRQNALAMGAQFTIDPSGEDTVARGMEITDGVGYDHVFEVSGAPAAALPCLDLLAKCGTATYFAVFPPSFEMPLNLHDLYMKEGRIQTVFTSPAITQRAIDLIPRLQTDKIIGKIYDLEDGMEAVEMFHKSIYPKILLKCD